MADDDAAPEEHETTHENAAELLSSGIAELERAGGEYEGAIESLGECLRIRSELDGELAPSLALPLRKNGDALLQKIRAESQAFDTSAQAPKKQQQQEQRSANDEREQQEDANKDCEGAEGENPGEEDEDPTDDRLAWELLETARKINEQHGESSFELAEVYATLGELGLEQSQFDQALSDLRKALELYKQNIRSDDRRIANALHRMSLACQFNEQPAEALEHATNAQRVLEKRLENLRHNEDEQKEKEGQDSKRSDSDEAEELRGILEEMRAHVQTLESDAQKYEQTKKDIAKVFSNMFGVSLDKAQMQQNEYNESEQAAGTSGQQNPTEQEESQSVQNLGVVGRSAGKRKVTPQKVDNDPTAGASDQRRERVEADRDDEGHKKQRAQEDDDPRKEEHEEGEKVKQPPMDTEEKPSECKQQ